MVHTIKNYRHSQRHLSKLIALKRGIARMARNFELDGSDIIELLEKQIAAISAEIDRYEELPARCGFDSNDFESLSKAPSNLIQARISLCWSQTEFAKRVGLTPQQVYKYEKCNYAPIRLSKVLEIADVLKKELETRESFIGKYQIDKMRLSAAADGD